MLTLDSFSAEDSTYQKEAIRMECQSVVKKIKKKYHEFVVTWISPESGKR